MSDADETVSHWIAGLCAGDDSAAARLWQRYYTRLVGLACQKLGSSPRRMADEEDRPQRFKSFCQRASQ